MKLNEGSPPIGDKKLFGKCLLVWFDRRFFESMPIDARYFGLPVAVVYYGRSISTTIFPMKINLLDPDVSGAVLRWAEIPGNWYPPGHSFQSE